MVNRLFSGPKHHIKGCYRWGRWRTQQTSKGRGCQDYFTNPTWEACIWSPIPHFLLFSLNIARLDGIYYTITIILELESPILLQELGLDLLITFLGGGGLPIFLNVVTELPHRSRLSISRRIIKRVPKVCLKISSITYGIILVTSFGDLGIAIENCLFLQAFNIGPVPLACIKIGKEEVI